MRIKVELTQATIRVNSRNETINQRNLHQINPGNRQVKVVGRKLQCLFQCFL